MPDDNTPENAPSFLTDVESNHGTSSKLRPPKVNTTQIQSADDDLPPFLPSQSALVANYDDELSPRKPGNQRAIQYDEITRALQERSPRKEFGNSPRQLQHSASLHASTTGEGDEEIMKAQAHLEHMRQLRIDTEDRLRRQKGSEKQRMNDLREYLARMSADEEKLVERITQLQEEQQRRKEERHRAMMEAREREKQWYVKSGKSTHLHEVPMFKKMEDERKAREMQQEMQRSEYLAKKRQEQQENKFKKDEISQHKQKHDEVLREKLVTLSEQRVQNMQKLKSPRSEPHIPVSKALQQTREMFDRKVGVHAYEVEKNREKILRSREYAAHVKIPSVDRAKMEEVEKRRKREANAEAERMKRKTEGEERLKQLMRDKQLASRLVKQGNTEVRKLSPEKFRKAAVKPEEEEKNTQTAQKYTNYLAQMRAEREKRNEEEGVSTARTNRGSHLSKEAKIRELSLRIERQEQRVQDAENTYKDNVVKFGSTHEETIRAGTCVDELRCELIDLKFEVLAVKEDKGEKKSKPRKNDVAVEKRDDVNNAGDANVDATKSADQEVDSNVEEQELEETAEDNQDMMNSADNDGEGLGENEEKNDDEELNDHLDNLNDDDNVGEDKKSSPHNHQDNASHDETKRKHFGLGQMLHEIVDVVEDIIESPQQSVKKDEKHKEIEEDIATDDV